MLAGMAGIAAGALLTRGAKAGPLDPPAGPVTSTGKTLTEVEPRRAVNSTSTPGTLTSVFRISQPGSYYLTGNVLGESGKTGITIASDDVTLDLNGFALIGTTGATGGIRATGFRNNLTVRNGVVRNWPDGGVNLIFTGSGLNSLIEGVIARSNGSLGLHANNNAIVRGCVAENNSGIGILIATSGVVTDCSVRSNSGTGIAVGESSVVQGCSVLNNGSSGISTGASSIVQDCCTTNNSIHGIVVASRCYVRGNASSANGSGGSGAGIRISGGESRIEDNNCIANGTGVEATGSGNFIARNTCRLNTLNWSIAANNKCLVVQGVNAPAISGNSGGTSPGSTNPYANFTT